MVARPSLGGDIVWQGHTEVSWDNDGVCVKSEAHSHDGHPVARCDPVDVGSHGFDITGGLVAERSRTRLWVGAAAAAHRPLALAAATAVESADHPSLAAGTQERSPDPDADVTGPDGRHGALLEDDLAVGRRHRDASRVGHSDSVVAGGRQNRCSPGGIQGSVRHPSTQQCRGGASPSGLSPVRVPVKTKRPSAGDESERESATPGRPRPSGHPSHRLHPRRVRVRRSA